MSTAPSDVCTQCQKNPPTVSALIAGKLYKNLCQGCYNLLLVGKLPSSASAQYDRERDIEDHLGDVQQPYDADGKPNRGFIELYPDKAKQMFTEDELRQYG